MQTGKISVIPVTDRDERKQFLDFPYDLYRGEAHWRAPLRFERATQINPQKNPALEGLETQLFLAIRKGPRGKDVVGRIAAIVNPRHLAIYNDATGHFGFLDSQKDSKIVKALIDAAQSWLKERGMTRIVGPLSFSINEEAGLLVNGFDTPPVLMMPYGRPDYQTSIEALGFAKAVDMHAYWTDMRAGYPRPKIVTTMTNYLENDPDITVRSMDKSRFLQEMQMAMGIFNDAWSDNWGFVPFSDIQVKHMAGELKPLLVADFFWVCEYKGEPAAFILMIPNINEAIAGLDGRLLPFGWAKLLYRLKIKGLKTARIPLMGVRREFQRTRTGLAMAAYLSEKVFEMARNRGFTHVEMGWILENNKSMIRIIEQAKGVPYKTYRMYEKPIS